MTTPDWHQNPAIGLWHWAVWVFQATTNSTTAVILSGHTFCAICGMPKETPA